MHSLFDVAAAGAGVAAAAAAAGAAASAAAAMSAGEGSIAKTACRWSLSSTTGRGILTFPRRVRHLGINGYGAGGKGTKHGELV